MAGIRVPVARLSPRQWSPRCAATAV